MAVNRVAYIFALISSVIFHAYYVGYFSFYLMILVIVIPWFSLLLSIPSIRGLCASVESPSEFLRGGEQRAYLKLRGQSWLPVSLVKLGLAVVVDNSQKPEAVDLICRGFRSLDVELPVDNEHCQSFDISVNVLKACDYLALFCIPIKKPEAVNIAIMPLQIAPTPEPELPPEIISDQLKPKLGGGFSEDHDLREYRDGDPARMIHWKLSSKRDELIIREPLVPERRQLIITLDIPDKYQDRDRLFDNLSWLSLSLLKHELPHGVRWIDRDGEAHAGFVYCEKDTKNLIRTLITTSAYSPAGKSSYHLGDGADWHYHLSGRNGGVNL